MRHVNASDNLRIVPRDRVRDLEAHLHRLARRGQELRAGRLKTTEDREKLEETRKEYARIHGLWVAARNQLRLF